jgi:hypothetical protein
VIGGYYLKACGHLLTILVILLFMIPEMADSAGDISKFQGTVTRLHPYNLQDLGLNGVDDGNIEVSINNVITGSSGLVGTKVVVYRLSDLGAYIDFSVQPGDQVEVYGIYLSPQRISGPFLFELVGSEHYLRKIIEPNQPNPNQPNPNQPNPNQPNPNQPSPNQPKCTWTFRCNNNVVQRLCVDQNRNEYWTNYDNCNNHKQPCNCINGVCVDTTPPDGSNQPKPTCDQQACQAQDGPIGQPYTLNGAQYQRYKDCNCEDGSCKCNQVEKQTPCSGIISGGVIDEKGMPLDNAQVSIQSGGTEWSGKTDSTGAFKSSQEFCPSTPFEAAADKQDYTSNKVDGSTDSNGNAVITIPITSESLGDVRFRGTVIKGGADESTQIISFYNFDVKITEILEDPKNRLKVGDLAQVVAHRDCQAKIDPAKDNDLVEVFGKCIPPQPNYQAHVDLGNSLSEGAGYYLIIVNSEASMPSYSPKISIPIGAPYMVSCHEGIKYRFYVKVENKGSKADRIGLSIECASQSLDITPSETFVELGPDKSKLIYINVYVKSRLRGREDIKITAASTGDSNKKESTWLGIWPNSDLGSPFLMQLFFKKLEGADTQGSIEIKSDNYVKLSKSHLDLTPAIDSDLWVVFDPKSFQTGIRSFEIQITSSNIEEPIIIPVSLDPLWNIIATDFDISKDGYSFANPPPYYCHGMAETSILYFNFNHDPQFNPNEPPPDKEKSTNDLTFSGKTLNRIEHYQNTILNGISNLLGNANDLWADDEINVLESELSQGRPVMLFMKSKEGEQHSVVAYKLYEYSTINYIVVYDNTYPFVRDCFNSGFNVIYYNIDKNYYYGDYSLGRCVVTPILKFL